MTVFQTEVLQKLNETVRYQNGTISYNTYDCKPNELIGHKKGDVYIKAELKKNDLLITVYLYTDEASVKVEGHSFMLERSDYKKDSNVLGKVLINFIQNYLGGEVPRKALEKARIQNGLPS